MMKKGKHAIIGIVIFLFLGFFPNLNASVISFDDDISTAIQELDSQIVQDQETKQLDAKSFSTSETPVTGTLDSVSIKQSGVYASSNVSARTDTGDNSERNITIDEANGWFASEATIEAFNLKRLYAENGTFDNDASAWTADFNDPDGGQTQSASYNSTEDCVAVRNVAVETNDPQNFYTHYGNSWITWGQTVNNTPYTSAFSFSVRFLYATGPLDPEGDDFITDYIYLAVFFDSNGWGRDLVTLPARNEWNEWTFDLEPTGLGDTFYFEVGLFVVADIVLDWDLDYDDDGSPDHTNVTTIDLLIDDISLTSTDTIGFDEVDMVFQVDSWVE
ncbi:MAG: hypothetical protein ACFE7R_01590, partial [Candidatus Hodarchaeota archaeon]